MNFLFKMASDENGEVPGAIRLMVKVWGAFSALCKCNFKMIFNFMINNGITEYVIVSK